MTTSGFYRECPRCGSRRGVDEIVCGNDLNGSPCNWDLTSEEIRDAHEARGSSAGSDEPNPVAGTGTQPPLRCPNGHAVSPGDLLCPECGCELTAAPPAREIAGWAVLSELPADGSVRTRYRVRREPGGREAVLTLYSPGAEPDVTVYEALQRRVPHDHIAELLEFGRWDGRAYDVTEEILGGSLVSLEIEPGDTAMIARLVDEIGRALAAFMDVGLRHRALSPDKILVRSREPLDVVITGFESGRLSDLDLDVESPLEVTRYTAPEAIMGGVASASDWWGLGMILLGILTRGECFAGINDQLFLIHVNATGAPIPRGLDPRLELLLRGLLTVDRSQRWQWKEVRAWLDGESPAVADDSRGQAGPETGPTLSLGGRQYMDARRFAIDASRAANWAEACDLLARGQIARWAEDLKLDGRTVSGLRDLGQRFEPVVGLRLGVALQLLNPQLPLIFEEAIVNPPWLLSNPAAGYDLIAGPIPDLLSQYGVQPDNWLQRLARRASAIRARAEALGITLDEESFQVLALSTSRARLTALWDARRRDFPDAWQQSLASILGRKQHSDEDLILLLAATLDQFRSCPDIVDAVTALATRYSLTAPPVDDINGHLARPRRELYALLDDRLKGFARCGQERCDAWADEFRLERRLPIESILLLLNVPESRWAKPPHQEYVSSVLDFFEKKISGAILRGQLVRMTIAKTTPRIDVTELALDLDSAAALLENLLQKSDDRTFRLDARVFENPDGPERRMRNLLSRTSQYQRDTGINGTYIAFPFLLRRDRAERSAPRLAPILLWPVKVNGEVGSRGDFSVAFDGEGREVLLNPAFTGMFGLEGAREWQSIAGDVLERAVTKIGEIIDAFGVKAAPAGRSLEPLPRDLSGVAAGDERCVCSAVLFHMEFMGQSLVEDLRQLKQRPAEGTALEPMLRVAEMSSGAGTNAGGRPGHVPISDRYLITHSDPSQEEAIVRARSAPGLLIQGPPGTGKSQTIVNLVADCIGHRRSVLIVCQKLPALEVVRKRLVAEDLENRLAMVTNVTKDRQPLLRAVREQLETLAEADASDALRNQLRAEGLAKQIETLEAQIDGQHHAVARIDDVSGQTYRQILADLIALEETASGPPVDAPALRRLLSDQADVAVADLQESCGAVAGQWLEAEYENSPLSTTLQFPHDEATIAEFRASFSQFVAAEKVRAALPPRRATSLARVPAENLDAWLREHRGYLESLSDSQLAAAVPLQALFRDHGIGDVYRELVASLLTLQRQHSREPVAAEIVGELLTALNTAECDVIAGLCGQHASLWLSAGYEESPLHILQDFEADPDVCRDVQAVLQDFDTVENHRMATARKHEYVIPPTDPDRLATWIAEHATFVRGVAEDHLRCFAVCGPAFEVDRFGSQYIETLERLAALYASDQPRIDEPPGLRNLVSQLDENQASRLAGEMSRHVADWVAANYENSPLRVLLPFGSDRHTCDAFQADFAVLLAAEESRAALGPPSELALSLHDPEPLAAWLEKYGGLLRGVPAVALSDASRRQRLFQASTLGSRYIAVLEAGVALPVVSPSAVPALAGLKPVLAPLHENECDILADACASIAPLWLEANYENSPLRVLLPFGSDRHTCDAFQADFAVLLAAEESRAALGPPSELALSLHDPEPLAAWLEKYGGLLRGVSEARLQEIASRLSLFESPTTVSAYIRLLQQSLNTEQVTGVDQQVLVSLQDVIAALTDSDIAAAIADCEAVTPLWLETNYEASALHVLSTFGSSPHSTEAFRKDFTALLAAEESRAALGPPSELALSLNDPEPLAAWLETNGSRLRDEFQIDPQLIGRLLRVARDGDLLDCYEDVLQQLAARHAIMTGPLTHVPDLEYCLDSIPEPLAAKIEYECTTALREWLDSEVDKVLLDSLASFPQDVSETIRLRESLRLLAEAEGTRINVVARCPQTLQVSDADAVRAWIAQYEQTLSTVAGELSGFLTTAYPLFDRGTAAKSQAELLYGDLRKLRAEIRGLELHKLNQAILERLIAASPEDRASLTAAVSSLCRRSLWSFLSLEHRRAYRYVAQWLRELGISPAQMPPTDFARHAEAANAVHELHRRASGLLVEAGLGVPPSPQWHQCDLHLKTLLTLFPAAHRVWLAVMRCPASFSRHMLLQKATPSALRRFVEVVRDSADLHEAKQRSLAALNALTPLMAPSWLGARRDSISLNMPTADNSDVLEQLVRAIAQLDRLQAFRDRIAGCHPLTLKALGAMTPVREFLRGCAPQERAPALKAVFRHHRLLARKRYLESMHDSLARPDNSDPEHVEKTLRSLAATRRILERVKRCPVPGFLEDAMLSGLASRLSDALHEMRAAIVQAQAAQTAANALDACRRWFSPDWISRQKRGVQRDPFFLVQLRAIQSALPTLASYLHVRLRLERALPVVAAAVPLVAAAVATGSSEGQNVNGTIKALMTSAWWAAQRQFLAAHNSLLQSLGECRSRAQQQEALGTLLGGRDISEAILACPVTGELQAGLSAGSRERLLESLAECESAVAYARATQAAQVALGNCGRWFDPEWIRECTNRVRLGRNIQGELQTISPVLSSVAVYQETRARLAGYGPEVAPTLKSLLSLPRPCFTGDTGDDSSTFRLVLRRLKWEQQREALEAEESVLRAFGGMLSTGDHESLLHSWKYSRDISEAILACPVTGELQAGLSAGSRERLLESLAECESAVAYARATQAAQVALGNCGRWFDTGFVRTCREAISGGGATVERLREVDAALPTLSVYQSVREAIARHEPDRLHDGLQVLAPCRTALCAMPTDALSGSVHQLVFGTWLDERRAKLEASEPRLRNVSPVSSASYDTTHRSLLVVRELASRLSTCPEQQAMRSAIVSGAVEAVSRTIVGFSAGLEVHQAQQEALAVLDRLEPWFSADWVAACRTAIYRGESNELALGPILAAAHTIREYQQFRRVVAACDPVVIKFFACLAAFRPKFEALPPSELATEVQRSVRYAAFTGKRLALERQHPALQAFRSGRSRDDSLALEGLTTAKRLQEATAGCPYGTEFSAAVSRSQPELLKTLLQEFAEAAEHTRAIRSSLTALQELSAFMQPEWVDATTQCIERGDDTHAMLDNLERALPHLRAYQLFRGRIRTLPDLAVRCFEVLGRYRGSLRGAADHQCHDMTVGDLVRLMIRREALLGWKNRLEAQEPALLADGAELAAKVERLGRLEIALRALNRQRLSQDLPIQQIRGRNEWTDITRLSGPRAVRLREFFRRGVDLGLLGLRPVWLTTPDVASQLLPLEKALFDLVIFDEASQMPVEYALPCLYRAKTAVVSGDDKQMPPSSFFAGRIESDEADVFDGEMPDETATDHEREAFEQAWNRREIKDCPDLLHLGEAVLARTTLQVHYRSEYRELIAYSNAAFYQNELGVPVRHPDEAVRMAKPIEYLNVSGTYVSQTNPEEARKVVDLLADLWLARVGEPPSVGVVTFNLRQAELIEEFLEERAEADLDFRLAYAREQSRITRGEDMSVFVKNVENVQGDERDWIIFSTTFGRTAKGQFSRNFGVLGQKGGERRLNVAVTRARRKVVIVSSMPIDDVSDMLKTRRKPETPRDYLQAYLQYARLASDGSLEEARRLSARLVTSGRAIEASASEADGFLDSVAAFIRSLGYEPVNTANDPILGVDFSIADPVTGLFGVGIECDPPRHRLTQRARAREIWRPSVLERAYRVVHRVSPYAWYHDRDGERRRLQAAIMTAMGPAEDA